MVGLLGKLASSLVMHLILAGLEIGVGNGENLSLGDNQLERDAHDFEEPQNEKH